MRHRSRRSDGGAACSRRFPCATLVPRPWRSRRPLRPRRRCDRIQPDHRLVGVRSAVDPSLGHGHVGPVHLAVQARGRRRPRRPRTAADQCVRRRKPVVEARTAPPDDDARLRDAHRQIPPCPRPDRSQVDLRSPDVGNGLRPGRRAGSEVVGRRGPAHLPDGRPWWVRRSWKATDRAAAIDKELAS